MKKNDLCIQKRALEGSKSNKTEQERQALLQKRELRRKRWIRRLALGFFLLLIFCTFASAQVERMRFPRYRRPGRGRYPPAGQKRRGVSLYRAALRALYRRTGLSGLAVFQEHTRFGMSYSVLALPAEILAMDEERAALDSGMGVELVLSSDRPLANEMEVMVTNDGGYYFEQSIRFT